MKSTLHGSYSVHHPEQNFKELDDLAMTKSSLRGKELLNLLFYL